MDEATGNGGNRTRVLAIAAGLVALVLLGRAAGGYLPAFTARVEGLGVWAPLFFIAGYAIAVLALVPASLLTLAAGAIFGVAKGVAYTFVAATLGATLAFSIARTVGRSAVEARLTGNARFAAIDRAVASEGRKVVFLLRLSPVFPFTLLNYALGLTSVSFADYVIASVGMLPGTLLYVYYGKVAGDAARLAAGASTGGGTASGALTVVGLAATVAATALITRTARRALRESALDRS